MREKLDIITCPCCGAEYLPAEIFLPNSFLGKPKIIDKDSSGKLIYYNGSNMNLVEYYTCDYCNKTFRVDAKIQFNTTFNSNVDFDEEYSTPLKKKRLFLLED